jgi:hypothetical protein
VKPEHIISGKLMLNKDGNQAWWSFLRDGASKGDGCNSVLGPMAVTVSEEVPPSTYSYYACLHLYLSLKTIVSLIDSKAHGTAGDEIVVVILKMSSVLLEELFSL